MYGMFRTDTNVLGKVAQFPGSIFFLIEKSGGHRVRLVTMVTRLS